MQEGVSDTGSVRRNRSSNNKLGAGSSQAGSYCCSSCGKICSGSSSSYETRRTSCSARSGESASGNSSASCESDDSSPPSSCQTGSAGGPASAGETCCPAISADCSETGCSRSSTSTGGETGSFATAGCESRCTGG